MNYNSAFGTKKHSEKPPILKPEGFEEETQGYITNNQYQSIS